MEILIIGNEYQFNKIDKNNLKNYKITQIDQNKLTNLVKSSNKYYYVILNGVENKSNNLKNILAKGGKIFSIEDFLEIKLKKVYLNSSTIPIKIKPLKKRAYFIKRAIDYFISITLLTLTFPLILYSIYRIKKESPDGPIFFTQNRIGKDGKIFKCYKFRTMKTNIKYFNIYTQTNDPRLFAYGVFMRKTRIDELPQLINVIKGDMHLIGPRAEWDILVKDYEKNIPNYHLRHCIAPGITGWAQVNYPYGRNIEDTKQKLMYDFFYIKNWSFMLELKTIFKTAFIMLLKKGH